MNRAIPYCLFSFTLLLISSCSLTPGPQLPETRPDNFSLEYHQGGGMTPEWEHIFISADSSWWEIGYMGNNNRHYFKTDSMDVTKLWNTLRTNFFLQIKTREEGEVHDRGGVTIRATWGNETKSISSSGGTFIEKEWEEHYNAVVKAITNLPMANMGGYFHEVELIVIDKTGGDSLSHVQIEFDGGQMKLWARKGKELFPGMAEKVKLLPGKYIINVFTQMKTTMPSLETKIEWTDSLRAVVVEVFPTEVKVNSKF